MVVIKKGDTSPAIQETLAAAGDLEGASAIFAMRNAAGVIIIEADAEITSVDDKTISYQWNEGETDTVGKYQAEFRITYADGLVETFPKIDFIMIYIEDNIITDNGEDEYSY